MDLFHPRNAIIALGIIIVAVTSGFYLFLSKDKQIEELVTNTSTSQSETSSSTITTTESTNSEDPTTEEILQDMLKEMTLDEKIGQLFLARVPETNQIEDIKKYHLGGYLLFGRDVEGETKDSLKNKLASYHEASQLPFLIAADEEGGSVTRISQHSTITPEPFKSPQSIYNEGGIEGIIADVDSKSQILKELGVNAGLYPVADVSTNSNSFIYDRTLGLDVATTSDYIVKVVEELTEQKSGSTLKHFPGYGDNQDSHTEIVRDKRSMEELEATSILPFKAGIDAGADSILVSHNIIEAIDETQPASISPTIHDFLRQELNFKGVIMTDDMDMMGLTDFISQEEAGLVALQSGNDLILSSTYDKQIPIIKEAIAKGEYGENNIDESVLRILTWKYKLELVN